MNKEFPGGINIIDKRTSEEKEKAPEVEIVLLENEKEELFNKLRSLSGGKKEKGSKDKLVKNKLGQQRKELNKRIKEIEARIGELKNNEVNEKPTEEVSEPVSDEKIAEEEPISEINIKDGDKTVEEIEDQSTSEPIKEEAVGDKGREELEQKLLQVDKLLSLYKDRGRFLYHLENLKNSKANENEIAVAQTKISEINYKIKGLYREITRSDIKGFPENEKRKIEEIMLAVEEGKMNYGKLAVRENEEKESRVLLEINKNLDRIKRGVQNLDYGNDKNRKMAENFIKELEEYKELTEVTLKIEGLGIVESANCVQLTKSITETIDEIKNKLEIEPEPETPEIKTEEKKRREAKNLEYEKTARESSDKMRHRVTKTGEKIASNPEMSDEDKEKLEKEMSKETVSSIMFDLNRDSYEEDPKKRREMFEAAVSAMKASLLEQKTICERKKSELTEAKKEAVEKFGIVSMEEIREKVSKKDGQQTGESKKGGLKGLWNKFFGNSAEKENEEENERKKEFENDAAIELLKIVKEEEGETGVEELFKDERLKDNKTINIKDSEEYVEKIANNLLDKYGGDIEELKEEIKKLKFGLQDFKNTRENMNLDEDVVDVMKDSLPIEPIEEVPEVEISKTGEVSEEIKVAIRKGLVKLKERDKMVFNNLEGFINSFSNSEKSFEEDFSKVQFNSFIKGDMDLEYEEIENVKTSDFINALREIHNEVKGEESIVDDDKENSKEDERIEIIKTLGIKSQKEVEAMNIEEIDNELQKIRNLKSEIEKRTGSKKGNPSDNNKYTILCKYGTILGKRDKELFFEKDKKETGEITEEMKGKIRSALVKMKISKEKTFNSVGSFIDNLYSPIDERPVNNIFNKASFNDNMKNIGINYDEIKDIKAKDFVAVLREIYNEVKGEEDVKKEKGEMTEEIKRKIKKRIQDNVDVFESLENSTYFNDNYLKSEHSLKEDSWASKFSTVLAKTLNTKLEEIENINTGVFMTALKEIYEEVKSEKEKLAKGKKK